MNGGRIQRVVTHGTFELDGGSWEVNNNIWIVGDHFDVVVFDAAHDAAPIVTAVGGRNVVAVVCTHGHNDHVTVAPELGEALDAPVLLHPADEVLWRMTHPAKDFRGVEDGATLRVGTMRTDWAGSSMAVAQRSPDYAPTVGAMAARLRAANGTEPIDPDRIARAFVQIAELNDPPLHPLLGSDAVDLAAAALQKTTEEDQQWAQLGRSVDFDAR